MAKVATTLKKRNNIINLELEDINKSLSINTLKIYNWLYAQLQLNRANMKQYNFTLNIKQTTLKDALDIKQDHYNELIKESLKELLDTKVVIKNFTSFDGKIIREFHTHLINDFSDYVDKDDNKTKCFSIKFSETLFNEMVKRGQGYTNLEIKNIKALNSSYQIRLYEYLKSYQGMGKSPHLSIKDLNNIFFTNKTHMAELELIINRCIKTLEKKTDFIVEYLKDKKNKEIYFKIVQTKNRNIQKQVKARNFKATKKVEEEKFNIDEVVSKIKSQKS